MNNQCKAVFICTHSEKTPCAYHSREVECKWCKVFNEIKSCTSKQARMSAMDFKLKKLGSSK